MDTPNSRVRYFIKLTGLICLFVFIYGCKNNQAVGQQVKDHDLTLQIMRLPNGPSDEQIYTYKARITPQKALLDDKSQNDKELLMYQMDSCFYLESGANKIYASLVQPVANGISGSFEYLLEFEKVGKGKLNSTFIYQDKYLNRKKYTIELNQENF